MYEKDLVLESQNSPLQKGYLILQPFDIFSSIVSELPTLYSHS